MEIEAEELYDMLTKIQDYQVSSREKSKQIRELKKQIRELQEEKAAAELEPQAAAEPEPQEQVLGAGSNHTVPSENTFDPDADILDNALYPYNMDWSFAKPNCPHIQVYIFQKQNDSDSNDSDSE